MYVRVCIYMYVWTTNVCMYVCMYVCTHQSVHINLQLHFLRAEIPRLKRFRSKCFLETTDHGQGGPPVYILDYTMPRCRKLYPECLSYVITYLRLMH
jgi:hypothetical protein